MLKNKMIYAGAYVVLGILALALFYLAWQAYQHPTIVVEWSTASELDTIGFNVLRSETPEGDLEQVNSELIPSSVDPLAGAEYSFEDKTVQAGKTYYYYLEDIDNQGTNSRNGPIEVVASAGGIWEAAAGAALLIVVLLGLSGLRTSKTLDEEPHGSF